MLGKYYSYVFDADTSPRGSPPCDYRFCRSDGPSSCDPSVLTIATSREERKLEIRDRRGSSQLREENSRFALHRGFAGGFLSGIRTNVGELDSFFRTPRDEIFALTRYSKRVGKGNLSEKLSHYFSRLNSRAMYPCCGYIYVYFGF